jgi:hypothetical protein
MKGLLEKHLHKTPRLQSKEQISHEYLQGTLRAYVHPGALAAFCAPLREEMADLLATAADVEMTLRGNPSIPQIEAAETLCTRLRGVQKCHEIKSRRSIAIDTCSGSGSGSGSGSASGSGSGGGSGMFEHIAAMAITNVDTEVSKVTVNVNSEVHQATVSVTIVTSGGDEITRSTTANVDEPNKYAVNVDTSDIEHKRMWCSAKLTRLTMCLLHDGPPPCASSSRATPKPHDIHSRNARVPVVDAASIVAYDAGSGRVYLAETNCAARRRVPRQRQKLSLCSHCIWQMGDIFLCLATHDASNPAWTWDTCGRRQR